MRRLPFPWALWYAGLRESNTKSNSQSNRTLTRLRLQERYLVSLSQQSDEKIGFDSAAFFQALDAIRMSRGLQWRQVAQEAKVSASTLTRMAQGKRPDVDGLAALSRWAGLIADKFFGESAPSEDPVAEASAALFRANPDLDEYQKEALKLLVANAYKLAIRGRSAKE